MAVEWLRGALHGASSSKHAPLTPQQVATYIAASVLLTLMAGLMSGLTLGLLSLDALDLEVLARSGTPAERRHAAAIKPLVERQHLMLVTLLLVNAAAMEALPLVMEPESRMCIPFDAFS